jgi:hypothetical protein
MDYSDFALNGLRRTIPAGSDGATMGGLCVAFWAVAGAQIALYLYGLKRVVRMHRQKRGKS